jgi:hypothetical protein
MLTFHGCTSNGSSVQGGCPRAGEGGYTRTVRSPVAVLSFVVPVVLGIGTVASAGDLAPEVARSRVEHHLRRVDALSQHFEDLIVRDCPHFASSAEWETYLDGEVDRFVLLVAHVEQAWVEAKRTGDDDVRREAKAPRKRVNRARLLVDKLETCADTNRASVPTQSLMQRIEREVPQRQSEIALPQ